MENEILDRDLMVEKTDVKHEYAGFWTRVGASLVDLVVYLPVIGVNMYNIYSLKSLPILIATSLVLISYKTFMEYQYGGTLGKMAVKVKVTNRDFEAISMTQALIRNSPTLLSQAVSMISAILLFQNPEFQEASSMFEIAALQNTTMSPIPNYVISIFTIISCVTVAANVNKQGLHDMMAGTFVVKS